jgi:hypothetical protein
MSEGRLDLSRVLAPAVRAKLAEAAKIRLLRCCGIGVAGDAGGWRAQVGCTGIHGPTRAQVIDLALELLHITPDLWPSGLPPGVPRWGRSVRARGPLDPALEKAIRAFREIGRVDAGPEIIFDFLRDAAAHGQTATDVLVSVGIAAAPGATWEQAIHELDDIWPWLNHDEQPHGKA